MYIKLKKKLPADMVILKMRVGAANLPVDEPMQIALGVMRQLVSKKLAVEVDEKEAKAFKHPNSGKTPAKPKDAKAS